MSEFSGNFSEYEKVSGLFRQMNEAALDVQQMLLGIKQLSIEEQNAITNRLDEALANFTNEPEISTESGDYDWQSQGFGQVDSDDFVIVSSVRIMEIRRRIKNGLRNLTPEDLEIIENITDRLDSTSEVLFRRIRK